MGGSYCVQVHLLSKLHMSKSPQPRLCTGSCVRPNPGGNSIVLRQQLHRRGVQHQVSPHRGLREGAAQCKHCKGGHAISWRQRKIHQRPTRYFCASQNLNISHATLSRHPSYETLATPWSLQEKFLFSLLMTLSQSGTYSSRSQTFHRRLLRTTGRY